MTRRSKIRKSGVFRATMLTILLLFISVFLWGALVWFVSMVLTSAGYSFFVNEGFLGVYVLVFAFVVILASFSLFYWLLKKRMLVKAVGG